MQHAFVREFTKQSPTSMQIWTWHKKIKKEGENVLTCVVSQAERILNMCEIGYEIHISHIVSFKLRGIALILFNIKLWLMARPYI